MARAAARERPFLDPAVVARLGTLELKARTIVEGFLSGLHRSPFKGFSVEFAEYRQYMPGDDLATIDWKVYARSDRHYVKKFEEETNLDCHLHARRQRLDGLRLARGMTKFEYGACLAASLALPDEPPARRGRPDRVRRRHRRHAAGERAAGPSARAAGHARPADGSGSRPTSSKPLHQLADALDQARAWSC